MASPKERLVDLFRALDARGCGRVPRAAFEGALRLACSGDPAQREALDAVLAHAEGDEIRYEELFDWLYSEPSQQGGGAAEAQEARGPAAAEGRSPRGLAEASCLAPRAQEEPGRRAACALRGDATAGSGAAASGAEATPEQLRDVLGEAGVAVGREDGAEEAASDEVGGGRWWWGHSTGRERPPGCPVVLAAATELLPPYIRDMARWSRCPAYADHVAHERGGRGPFAGGTVYQTHEECDRLLRGHCVEWESGEVVRKNELGFLVLDDGIFPAPHRSLSLAHPVDVHRVQRRFARELIGRIPGRGTLLQEVSRFMHGRTRIEFPRDVDVWWSRMLWTYVAGHDVDEAFAHGFIKMRDSWLLGSAGHVGQISVLDLKFTNDGVLRGQVKYRDMIAQKLPFEVQEEHRALVAQGILEMFCFAGGLSVPSTIRSAVACIYTGIMTEAITLHNVEAFVYEVTRLFPAVQGFPWHKDGHRHIAHLAAALRDPKAWGPDSDKFTLKDLNTYREKHIGFAKSARSATDDNNSRFCPGAQQALDACQAFVLVLSSPSSCHKLVAEPAWRSAERIQPATKPDYFKSFALERDGVNLRENLSLYQSFVDGSQTGEQAFADCTPEDFQSFIKTVDSDGDGVPDALSAMDEFTKFFYRASTLAWEDNYHITEVEVPRRPAAPLTSHNSVVLPVGGVRMPTEDEQWSGTPVWKILAQRAFRVLASRSSDSVSEQLLVRDDESRRRAVCLARLAFAREREGSHLPPAKDVWREFSSDPAQGLLALYGWGQLDLQRNKEPAREGLGEFVVDPLSRLFGSIPVRDTEQFERLGASAFFDRGDSGELRITAIHWCHGGCVVRPGDDAWEHAKYVWRCSLGVKVTAVDHLVHTHWIVSNAFSTSLRESFRADHPIRRLLHVNIFNTASVNYSAFWGLYPKDGFLHRMTPWEHDGLVNALEAGFSSFRYRTWPQAYDECDMPEDLKATMPMWEDGLAVWKMLREWHAAYIDLYYDTELHVLADPEIQQYWTFRTTPQYTRGLPPLSKEALIDQVTHSVFWACAFHEFVGGAVEYVTDPGGLFLQVRPGQTMADMQHMVQAQSLTAATGSPMPKLSGDWSYLLDLGHSAGTNKLFERVRVLHGGLARRMREVSAEIAERNTRRPQSFSAFDPLTFECSVSL